MLSIRSLQTDLVLLFELQALMDFMHNEIHRLLIPQHNMLCNLTLLLN